MSVVEKNPRNVLQNRDSVPGLGSCSGVFFGILSVVYGVLQLITQYRRLKITLFEDFKKPIVNKPTKPADKTADDYDLEVKIYMADYSEYIKETKDLENTLEGIFDVVYGQCIPLMRVKLNVVQNFKDMKEK